MKEIAFVLVMILAIVGFTALLLGLVLLVAK